MVAEMKRIGANLEIAIKVEEVEETVEMEEAVVEVAAGDAVEVPNLSLIQLLSYFCYNVAYYSSCSK